MGYMRHHAIIVTSWDNGLLWAAHDKATKIFPKISPIVPGETNSYTSFFIPPDGSKEGWDESDAGNERRKEFIEWLDSQRYNDNSTSLDWVEVQYGDDNRETIIICHSSEREIA